MIDRLIIGGSALMRTAQEAGVPDAAQRIDDVARSIGVPLHTVGGEQAVSVEHAWQILTGLVSGSDAERSAFATEHAMRWAQAQPVADVARQFGVPEAHVLATLEQHGAPLLAVRDGEQLTRLVPHELIDALPFSTAATGAAGGDAATVGRSLAGRFGSKLGVAGALAGAAGLGAFVLLRFQGDSSPPSGTPSGGGATPGGSSTPGAGDDTTLATTMPKLPSMLGLASADHPELSADELRTVSTDVAAAVAKTDANTVEGKRARIAERALAAATTGATTTDAAGALTPDVAAYMGATAGATAAADRPWHLDFANWATHDAASMGYDGAGLAGMDALSSWSTEAKAYVTLEQRAARVGDVVVLDDRGDDLKGDTVGIVVGHEGSALLVVQGDMANQAGAHAARLTRYVTSDGRVLGVVDAAGAQRLATPVPPPPPPPAPAPVASAGGAYHMGNLAPDQLATWAEPDGPRACGIAAAMAFIRFQGGDPAPSDMLATSAAYGYTSDAGFATDSMRTMLADQFGVATNVQRPPDFEVVKQQLLSGKPVIVSTIGHFWVLEGYDPATDTYNVGPTARPYGRWDGNPWMTAEAMRTLSRSDQDHEWRTMVTLA
ncbi:MAG: C39 family peptidase [Thermoleophilia bacterium]|nr:C39 family peptidase [Thermoleophilia bacterium]